MRLPGPPSSLGKAALLERGGKAGALDNQNEYKGNGAAGIRFQRHPNSEASEGSMAEIRAAAGEIANFLIHGYRNERGVHVETLIGGAGALAGEFALRAAEPVLPESGWVMSEKASDLIFGSDAKGETGLWGVILAGAVRAGAEEDKLPKREEVAARTAAAVGGSPYPPITAAKEHYPLEWSPNACPRLRGSMEKIARAHGLNGLETAKALAYAIAVLIAQTKDALAPETSATLALEIMVGVSHMVPMKEPIT